MKHKQRLKFKKFLSELSDDKMFEETTSGDIATVDTKLDLSKRHKRHECKGKKCKEHKLLNCEICQDIDEERWN